MRGMNMMQLLGGVAVAGVIAAGSTAFTAAGLTKTLSATPSNGFIGGTVSHTVTGATLTSIVFAQTANAGENRVTGATLTFDASTPDGAAVTMTSDGTIGGSAVGGAATGYFCGVVQANHTSTCGVGFNSTPNGDYYSTVTSVVIGIS